MSANPRKRTVIRPSVSYDLDEASDNNNKKPKQKIQAQEETDNIEKPKPTQKQKQTKSINFKFQNPKNNKDQTCQIPILEKTSIQDIIQILNDKCGINNIIGFERNGANFMKENNILFSETSLNYIDISSDIEVNLIFKRNPKVSEVKKDINPLPKNRKQQIKIIYMNNSFKTDEIDFSAPASEIFDNFSSNSLTNKVKPVLYFPGGNMMTTSFNDFMSQNEKCTNNILYLINAHKSNFDPKQADERIDISKKSICALFPDLTKNNSYVCLLCCFLQYIHEKFYKSQNTINAFFETVKFIPFVTSLNCIYNGKVTNLTLFTVTSFLHFYAPDFENLRGLIMTMSSYLCKTKLHFKKLQKTDYSFIHDFKTVPQLPKPSNCFNKNLTACNPIFEGSVKDLCNRKYWTIVPYNKGYILCNINKDESVSYYDPTQNNSFNKMDINELKKYEKESANPIKNQAKTTSYTDPNIKYSQATVSIIDYSSSMIACFNEENIRRSQIAVNIINKFIQAGKDLSVSDPFILLDRKCQKTSYPLEYNKDDFLKPSRVYDRIEQAIKFLSDDSLKKSLTDNAYKRIFLVTDGQGDRSTNNDKYSIYQLLRHNCIFLDVILLKQGKTSNDLCTISHLSRGNYYYPKNLCDAYFISSYYRLLRISGKEKIFNFKPYKNISKEEFEKKSNNIRIKDDINSIRIRMQNDFYINYDLYSPFCEVPIRDDFLGRRIQKEIDICADYQQRMLALDKEPFLRIYRHFQDDRNIEKEKVIVFLKGNPNSPYKVIHQVLVTFDYYYPIKMPSIKIKSSAQIDETYLINDEFVLDEPYTPDMRLIDILRKISFILNCKEKPVEKDNYLDPIKSLDQVELVFDIYDGMTRKIQDYSKYYKDIQY